MFDVVMPNNNEEEFIDVGLALGYSEICFLVQDMDYGYKNDKIIIKRACLIKSAADMSKAKKRFDYIFADASRSAFESNIDYIINAEDYPGRDSFHYRKTAFNQVHAKLARENSIKIVFSFAKLIDADLRGKQRILGRMMQNALVARKYKVAIASFTLTKDPERMRSRVILDAFLHIL